MVDAWSDWGLLSIIATGGAFVEFNGAIDRESMEITQGGKDFDIINLLNGGCIEKPTPEGEYTITFDGYFFDLDTTDNSGILQLFHTTLANWDTTEGATGLTVTNSHNRDVFKIAALFTDDRTITSANAAVAIGSIGMRFILSNARFVEATPVSFGDGVLKLTCKFKSAPYTKANAGNFEIQSSTGTVSASLAALATI